MDKFLMGIWEGFHYADVLIGVVIGLCIGVVATAIRLNREIASLNVNLFILRDRLIMYEAGNAFLEDGPNVTHRDGSGI